MSMIEVGTLEEEIELLLGVFKATEDMQEFNPLAVSTATEMVVRVLAAGMDDERPAINMVSGLTSTLVLCLKNQNGFSRELAERVSESIMYGLSYIIELSNVDENRFN
jgi:hypothetical protein